LESSTGGRKPTGSAQKATKTVIRTGPNWVFVGLAAVVAGVTAWLIVNFDPVDDTGIMALAAGIGLFASVLVVALARMDTNRRRRTGYVDAQVFFYALNALALLGWSLGMLAVFQLAYEISRDFT
jgi:hypothetical protein